MHVVNHLQSSRKYGTQEPGDRIPREREFAKSLKGSQASLPTRIGYPADTVVMKVRHEVVLAEPMLSRLVSFSSSRFGNYGVGV